MLKGTGASGAGAVLRKSSFIFCASKLVPNAEITAKMLNNLIIFLIL
jgi:hypothetical protein